MAVFLCMRHLAFVFRSAAAPYLLRCFTRDSGKTKLSSVPSGGAAAAAPAAAAKGGAPAASAKPAAKAPEPEPEEEEAGGFSLFD